MTHFAGRALPSVLCAVILGCAPAAQPSATPPPSVSAGAPAAAGRSSPSRPPNPTTPPAANSSQAPTASAQHTAVPAAVASPAEPAYQFGYPRLDLGEALAFVPQPEELLYQILFIDSDGPRMVFSEREYAVHPGDPRGTRIWLADLEQHTVQVVARTRGHAFAWRPSIEGNDVIWADIPKGYQGGDKPWRLMHLDLANGQVSEIASGVNRAQKSFGSAPYPYFAVDGGQFAFKQEIRRGGQTYEQVVVCELSGNLVRRIPVNGGRPLVDGGGLVELDFAEGDVAWVEGDPDQNGLLATTRLMLSRDGSPEPVKVADFPDQLTLRDGRLAWTGHREASAWRSDLRTFTARTDDPALTVQAVSRPPGENGLETTFSPSTGDGLVAWEERMSTAVTVVVWDSERDQVREVFHSDELDDIPSVSNGWLLWHSDGSEDQVENFPGFFGVPIADLQAAWDAQHP